VSRTSAIQFSLQPDTFRQKVGSGGHDSKPQQRLLSPPAQFLLLVWFALSFFPYPAVILGPRVPVFLNLIAFPVALLAVGVRRVLAPRILGCVLAVEAALAISYGAHTIAGDFDHEIAAKGILVFNVFFLQLLLGASLRFVAVPRILMTLLVVFGVHLIASCLMIADQGLREEIVLALFNHSFFGDPLEAIEQWRFSFRASGLFPEPSAMTASIGPWIGWAFGTALGAPKHATTRFIGFACAAMGVALVAISLSGYGPLMMLGLAGFAIARLRRSKISIWIIGLACMGLALAVRINQQSVWDAFKERTLQEQEEGNSWTVRAASLEYAGRIFLNGGGQTLLTGVGPFNSALLIQRDIGLSAVWSVLIGFWLENGLVGAAALGLLLWRCIKSFHSAQDRETGWLVFYLWLLGVTITTSYMTLTPLWATLGLLLAWQNEPGTHVPVPVRRRLITIPARFFSRVST
jgi:hypothetical protein